MRDRAEFPASPQTSGATGDLVESTDQLAFTDAEITRQALVHSSALTYLMVAYARACGQSPEHAADFAGQIFAKGWARFVGDSAQEVARHIALILICIGGEIESITGNDRQAEIRASGVVTDEDARFFGITRDEADRFCKVFVPMTASLGFDFAWRRDGDVLVYTLTAD
jgi:hypothetical protein